MLGPNLNMNCILFIIIRYRWLWNTSLSGFYLYFHNWEWKREICPRAQNPNQWDFKTARRSRKRRLVLADPLTLMYTKSAKIDVTLNYWYRNGLYSTMMYFCFDCWYLYYCTILIRSWKPWNNALCSVW